VVGRSTPFDELVAPRDGADGGRIPDPPDMDAPALYLFTSGSTGMPKAVIHSPRNIAAGTAMSNQVLFREQFSDDWTPPATSRHTVDWLPWHHISGSTMLWGAVNAGTTLHIDAGRPLPGQFDKTLELLRTVSPCFYLNVPVGYRMLVAELERDDDLRRTFFADLDFLMYGAASLPADIYVRMQELAVETVGHRLLFLSAYGSTETCGSVTFTYFECDPTGLLGLPVPGVEIKLVPHDRAYECRVKGANVTQGYLGFEAAGHHLFDEDGYLRTGDLVDWVDPHRPEMGLRFAGRLAEEFKLSSGTWVSGSALRNAVIDAAAPLVAEASVVGPNRDSVAVLVWLNEAECRARDAAFDPERPWESKAVTGDIRSAVEAYNDHNTGSSRRIARLMLMTDPLSGDAGELSDKGSVNHRMVRELRAAVIERLYSEEPGAGTMCFAPLSKEDA
jgi:feruloyl-CoA synthase